jgi:hypothetical protein
MRLMIRMMAICIAIGPILGCGSTVAVPGPAGQGSVSMPPIQLTITHNRETVGAFEAIGFGPVTAMRLADKEFATQLADVFTVRVDSKKDVPALLGEYTVRGEVLTFKPRFPLQPGVRYRAVVHVKHIPAPQDELYTETEATIELPKPKTAPTVVDQVYPTRDALPENQLRFYVHFSAPMSRGDVYKNIRLLDASGKPIELPFLELEQELWDVASQRFTLLIQPGRIKRGLIPREELGPVLEEGKSYTLEINRDWLDAEGEPLKETYRKKFRVIAADEKQPDPKTWKVQAPPAGKAETLVVTFPKPLDHGMLERVLWVTDDGGQRIEGTIAVTDEETHWRFTPKAAWRAGAYDLVVDMALEDTAGNSIAQPFEVDVFRPIERRVETKTVKVPFTVK